MSYITFERRVRPLTLQRAPRLSSRWQWVNLPFSLLMGDSKVVSYTYSNISSERGICVLEPTGNV